MPVSRKTPEERAKDIYFYIMIAGLLTIILILSTCSGA